MVSHAVEHEAEQAVWDIWVAVYPNFNEETFIPFSEFKKEQLKVKPRKEVKTGQQIVEEMAKVIQQYEERKRGD
jgi:hypothetical protein